MAQPWQRGSLVDDWTGEGRVGKPGLFIGSKKLLVCCKKNTN